MFSKLVILAALAVGAVQANAEVIQIQPDAAAGKDAAIADDFAADYNMATYPWMTANWGVNKHSGLIEFNLDQYAGKQVVSASLRLYAEYNARAGQVYMVSKNLSSWDENRVNFNNAPAAGPVLDTLVTANGSQWYSFDVTSAINDWLAGEANYGFQITETNGAVFFASSDHSPQLRPLLEMDMAEVPEPASAAIFAVGLFGLGALRRRRKN